MQKIFNCMFFLDSKLFVNVYCEDLPKDIQSLKIKV